VNGPSCSIVLLNSCCFVLLHGSGLPHGVYVTKRFAYAVAVDLLDIGCNVWILQIVRNYVSSYKLVRIKKRRLIPCTELLRSNIKLP
jgi:hypothetical protein